MMEEASKMVKLGISMKIWSANAYGAILIMDGYHCLSSDLGRICLDCLNIGPLEICGT